MNGKATAETIKMLAQANNAIADVMEMLAVESKRKSLAESAIYSYPRGGQRVSGPSIRLAEVDSLKLLI